MKSLVAIAVLAVAGGTTEVSAKPERLDECPLMVRFGSFASGIDGPAFAAVSEALRTDPRVASVTLRPWGREGERDLCVTPGTADDGEGLVGVVRDAVPARKLNGYVDIKLDGRRVFTTQSR